MMKEERSIANQLIEAMRNEETATQNKQNKEFLNNFQNQLTVRDSYDFSGPTNEYTIYEGVNGVKFKEMSLYDFTLTKEENFSNNDDKYVFFKVNKDGEFGVLDKENIIPCPLAKCLVNLSDLEDVAEEFTFMPVAYNSFMGVDVLNFMKYNSNFFTCDERVFFITLLVKFKSFDFKPFFWSKEKIFQEVGIKKDRANKIIKKFKELGFLSTELRKAQIDGRPMQVNYFDIDGGKIIDLLPQMLHSDEDEDGNIYTQPDIEKYLKPSIKKEKKSISSVMQ